MKTRQIGQGCLLLFGASLLVILLSLAVIAYWTLFLQIDDSAIQQAAARLVAASAETTPASRPPIVIVHGLWDGDADQASSCATTAGPVAYETLLAEHQYIPLHDLGPWLIEDGYAP